MSSPVILTGLALLDLRRRAEEEERRRRTMVGDDASSSDEESDAEPMGSRETAMPPRGGTGTAAAAAAADAADAAAAAEEGATEDAGANEDGKGENGGIDTRVCRFCFTGAECGTLIEPCACAGSQRFVHRRCLRRWFLVGLESRGAVETRCRVCHAPYTYESSRIARTYRKARWFSLTARDRVSEYSRAWFQWASSALLRHKGVTLPRSPSSAGNLALLVAESEVRIWAQREETREGATSQLPKLLRVGTFLFRAAALHAKVRLLLTPNSVVVTL